MRRVSAPVKLVCEDQYPIENPTGSGTPVQHREPCLQVFLPGAGWLEYDPTTALALIRVTDARHPGLARPMVGSSFRQGSDILACRSVLPSATSETLRIRRKGRTSG